jgi:hypothetical protein
MALFVSGADAADLDNRTNRLDPPPRYGNPTDVDEYKTHFIGFGIGVQGAIEHDVLQLNVPDIPHGGHTHPGGNVRGLSADGFNLGGEIDYLNGYGNGRIGAYCNGAWSNVDTTVEGFGIGGEVEIFRKEHQFGCGLKGGLVVENTTLLYAKFGHEWQKWSSEVLDGNADVQAWVTGGGVETMLRDNVSLDLGVDYLWLRDADDGLDEVFEDSDAIRGVVTLRYRM